VGIFESQEKILADTPDRDFTSAGHIDHHFRGFSFSAVYLYHILSENG